MMENTQGWECPKCHATYAPWVSRCQRCYEAGDVSATVGIKDYPKGVAVKVSDVIDFSKAIHLPINPEDNYLTAADFGLPVKAKESVIEPLPTITMPTDGTGKGFAGEA